MSSLSGVDLRVCLRGRLGGIHATQIPAVVAVRHSFLAGDVPGVVALANPAGDPPRARVTMAVAALDQIARLEVHGPRSCRQGLTANLRALVGGARKSADPH